MVEKLCESLCSPAWAFCCEGRIEELGPGAFGYALQGTNRTGLRLDATYVRSLLRFHRPNQIRIKLQRLSGWRQLYLMCVRACLPKVPAVPPASPTGPAAPKQCASWATYCGVRGPGEGGARLSLEASSPPPPPDMGTSILSGLACMHVCPYTGSEPSDQERSTLEGHRLEKETGDADRDRRR